jgi:cyclohexanone monooxygenase
MDQQSEFETVIVGSGFSGLCMAIRLKQAGMLDFVILEREAELGGTWRINNYPGCACDVPSHLYSFSFAQNPNWSRKFAQRDELWQYTRSVVAQFGLEPHIRTACALQSARFDGTHWQLQTAKGPLRCKSLVCATGPLSTPARPDLPGLATFGGKQFHSAQWDHDWDFTGKRVAVIGTGASSIQIIPQLVSKVARLDVYQRTAPWVLPRPDRAISRFERWLFRRVPPLLNLYRGWIYCAFELRLPAFTQPGLNHIMRLMGLRHLRRAIKDPQLRALLTPGFTPGCKRVLLANDYYPALAQPQVAVIATPVREVRGNAVIDANGIAREVDALIFATGFEVEHGQSGVEIAGRDGQLLSQRSIGGLEAYKGICVPGFPNFFMLAGPNTGLSHNSMIYMIESMAQYVLQALQLLRQHQTLEVKSEICHSYNQGIQQRLKNTVWSTGCKSWYLSSTGKNHALWPGFTFEYRRLTRSFDVAAYHVTK